MSLAYPAAMQAAFEARPEMAGDRRLLQYALGDCLLGLIAFSIACWGWGLIIGPLHARPVVPEPFHSKLEAMLSLPREAAPIDTVFVGSSRFFHGVDPAVFDRETARLGLPTHSYNLGFDALDFPELRFLVRHLLDDPRMHLKNLVIEPSLRARLAPGLENSERAVTLHDVEGSQFIANFVLRSNHDWKRKLFWLFEQGQVSLTRLSNVGVLTNAYIRPQETPPMLADLVGEAANGYVGLDPHTLFGSRVTAQDIASLRADQTAAEETGTARTLNDFEIDQLKELQQLAAGHGVRLTLLAHPTATPEMFGEFSAIARAEREGRMDIPFISFADPVTFFDLYDPAGFVDPDHINSIVADQVSIRAADAFVSDLKAVQQRGADAVH